MYFHRAPFAQMDLFNAPVCCLHGRLARSSSNVRPYLLTCFRVTQGKIPLIFFFNFFFFFIFSYKYPPFFTGCYLPVLYLNFPQGQKKIQLKCSLEEATNLKMRTVHKRDFWLSTILILQTFTFILTNLGEIYEHLKQ